MVLCDTCNQVCHFLCLDTSLLRVPDGNVPNIQVWLSSHLIDMISIEKSYNVHHFVISFHNSLADTERDMIIGT